MFASDRRGLTLAALLGGLLLLIFGIPVIWSLLGYGKVYGLSENSVLMPLVLMAVFFLVVVSIPLGWYILGKYTYGQDPTPKA